MLNSDAVLHRTCQSPYFLACCWNIHRAQVMAVLSRQAGKTQGNEPATAVISVCN